MSKKEALYILFSKSSIEGESLSKKYRPLNIFSSTRKISFDEIDKMGITSDELDSSYFANKEELYEFSRGLLQNYTQAEIAFLLSTNDFNIGIESCQDTLTFRNIFAKFGEQVVLSEDQKQKSLFNKFF
jgi:hypothetical protein